MIPACIRTGMCCTNLPLPASPRELREAYQRWHDGKIGCHVEDIDMIYPMLAGRCKGYNEALGKFIYGPCKHLDYEEKEGRRLAVCTVQENKPRMCSGYPDYAKARKMEMGSFDPTENRGTFRGCGFNGDPQAGMTVEEVAGRLRALKDNES